MKHTPLVSSLAVVTVAAMFLCVPARASAGAYPDKKPSAQSAPAPEEFRMSPGDKLRIEVYKDAQLSQSVQVRPDGKITLPLIGDVVAIGLQEFGIRNLEVGIRARMQNSKF